MTMTPVARLSLDDTVVAGWVRRLAGNSSPRRNHWQTKLIYFEAAAAVLESAPRPSLTWRSIVAAAQPRGRRSTFYEVAGAHARHRMVDDLISDGSSDSLQIALRYLRTDPVEQLIDEAKVWSFWPDRVRLAQRLTAEMSPAQLEAELTATVAAWARRNPAMAAAVGHIPPAAAVEDLTVLLRGRLSGTRSADRLTEVIRQCC